MLVPCLCDRRRERASMGTMTVCATLLLGLAIVLYGGTILWYGVVFSARASRVEEIRRLRQEGLAVNQNSAA